MLSFIFSGELDNICNNFKFEMYDKFYLDLVFVEVMG